MDNFKFKPKDQHSGTHMIDKSDINIEISSDYYEAYLTINFNDTFTSISKEDLLDVIEKKHISYGINYDVIEEIIKNKRSITKFLIAKGNKHKNGEDGKITYNFDINDSPRPSLSESGKADHKNLNIIHKVKKGEILGSRTSPTDGTEGITVTGKTIKGKPGKLLNLKPGKNTILSNDTNYLIANQNGFIKIVDERVCVIPILEINSDVGVSTGNIHFNGKIIVNGNVEKGYTIESEDEIEIYGIVEGSKIIATGDIRIHQGANNGASIISDNNITVKFMEGCIVRCGKKLICEAVLHCDIESKEELIVNEGKGLIVGGRIKVRKKITAKNIGSQIGTLTKLQLGIDDSLLSEYKNINDIIKQLKDNIGKLNQAITMLQPQVKLKSNDSKLNSMLEKSLSTKKQYLNKLKVNEIELNNILKIIDELKSAKISSDIIHTGVKIKINNSYYNPRSILKNVILMKDEGEIRALPKV